MTEGLTITTERVDDIPVLAANMEKMGVAALVDEHFQPHGNWGGISLGQVCSGWLAHILSEADHRMNHVQPWAEKRCETLRGCFGAEVSDQDFTDDRLEIALDALSEDEGWAGFETALNRRTVRVYDLKPQCVRLDGTTASGYWTVTETGLFQLGHSKDHRPDLPQLKVMQAALDPLGMPLVTLVASGETADDPLYIPAIRQVRQGLERRGLLYVGDCKLMAFETRVYLQAGGDHYLGPFSKVQVADESLETYLKPVWAGEQELTPVCRPTPEGPLEKIAEGYEIPQTLTATLEDKKITWVERWLVIRSLRHARAAEAALRTRLTKAQAALEALNERKQGKRRLADLEALRQAAEKTIQHYEVEGLLNLSCNESVEEHQVRQHKERPAETRFERRLSLQVSRDEAAIQKAIARLGWRVYATNRPLEQLSLEQAVLAYREEYLVERGFGRLKGKPLSLTPMYLQDDRRATGLIRLLTIGLRVLTLFEFDVRRRLTERNEELAGLYAGNPKRTTAQPTAESMLEAFQEINLNVATIGQQVQRYITPLSELQQKILALLDFPENIYTRLAAVSQNPP
jgi:transposase